VIGVRDGQITSHRTCASFDEALEMAGSDASADHSAHSSRS
jgi:hypothetical protein